MTDPASGAQPASMQWAQDIPAEQWDLYRKVIKAARERGFPFALGGAFAVAAYTGMWRNTKDIDLYILPRDRETMQDVLSQQGLSDYYEVLPYQRHWIYRAHQDDLIIDLIWSMPNERAEVDETWLAAGRQFEIQGEVMRALPAEELIWAKLYVMQKDRCDWPDIFNIIQVEADRLDWGRLMVRLDQDTPLLEGLLAVFCWLNPGRALSLPNWLLTRLTLNVEGAISAERILAHANLLDSRPWFVPFVEDSDSD